MLPYSRRRSLVQLWPPKKAADAEKGKRKPPTLYRKGELEKKDEEKKDQ